MRGLLGPAVVGSVLLAVLSTIADYVWFLNIPQHQVSSGAIHGAALFAALGAYLGWRKGQAAIGEAGLFPIAAPPAFPVAPIPLDESFTRLLAPQPRAAMLRRWRAAVGRHDNKNGGTNP